MNLARFPKRICSLAILVSMVVCPLVSNLRLAQSGPRLAEEECRSEASESQAFESLHLLRHRTQRTRSVSWACAQYPAPQDAAIVSGSRFPRSAAFVPRSERAAHRGLGAPLRI